MPSQPPVEEVELVLELELEEVPLGARITFHSSTPVELAPFETISNLNRVVDTGLNVVMLY